MRICFDVILPPRLEVHSRSDDRRRNEEEEDSVIVAYHYYASRIDCIVRGLF